MALLGAQLVITLIVISVIQKLGQHFSFGRWLLCNTGLVRYLYPTDDTLRQLANIPKEKPQKRGKFHESDKQKSFHIPKNLNFELETAKVTILDVIHLKYYAEYQWLIDFTIYSTIVYVITEVYQIFFSLENEINLSIIWCSLVIGYALKVLISLTVQYFQSDESIGERSACIVMGFTYLLISMIFLIISENVLELGLESAYASFNKSASTFLNTQSLKSTGPASKIVLKFFLSIWCAILGAIFTFPGLRTGKMHWDLLQSLRENKYLYLVVNCSFELPFILIILWIKPIARDILTVRIFSGLDKPLMTSELFDSIRIILFILTFIVRLILTPWYLQAYLNMAHRRVKELQKEAGRITNIDLQKKIAAVFYYLCVATIQYVAPIIICLYFTFMYKTLGKFNLLNWSVDLHECPANDFSIESSYEESGIPDGNFTLENLKSIFTHEVFRGLLGFATWWSCFSYFAATSLGLLYQMYFTGF